MQAGRSIDGELTSLEVQGSYGDDALVHVTSNVTDESEEVGPRVNIRRDLISRLTQSRNSSKQAPYWKQRLSREYEELMIRGMQGLYRRLPERSSYVLRNRSLGTMCEVNEENALATRTEDIRLRSEHVEKRIITFPMLGDVVSKKGGGSGCDGFRIIREAFLCELRDMYTILCSMEARKYDLKSQDVTALFEWFKLFENFVRIYLMCSEKVVYEISGIDEWGTLSGVMKKTERIREKHIIMGLCERMEGMKRKMIAKGKHCNTELCQLRKRADNMTMRILQFLNSEWTQTVRILEREFGEGDVKRVFGDVVSSMKRCVHGKEMVMILGSGVSGQKERTEWVRGWLAAASVVGVMLSMKRFVDRHAAYAVIFDRAHAEYRQIYRRLGANVDREMRRVHRKLEER